MSKPTTYHRHTNPRVVHADPVLCDLPIDHPVAVIDPRPNSDDMKRLIELFKAEWFGDDPGNAQVTIARAIARYAAGETAGPPPLKAGETDE